MAGERSLTWPTSLTGIPPSLHENVVEPEKPGDDLIALVRGTLGHARETAEHMRRVAEATHANPALTEPGKHSETKRVCENLAQAPLKRMSTALQKLDSAIGKLKEELASPSVDKSWLGSARSATRIQALLAMKPEERRQTLLDCIDQGDHLSIASALNEPCWTIGLSSGEHNEIRVRWQQRYKAEQVKRLEELERARDHLARGANLLQMYAASLFERVDADKALLAQRAVDRAISAATQGQPSPFQSLDHVEPGAA
jgi:hypothetical protein